jgi:hypothetical protein
MSRELLSTLSPSSLSPKLQNSMEFSPLKLVNSEQTSWFPHLLWKIYISKTFRKFLKQCYTRKIMSWTFWGRAAWYIFLIVANEIHYFSALFWYTTLHVSDRLTVHYQESRYCICHTTRRKQSLFLITKKKKKKNYVEYKHIFLPLLKLSSKMLCHVFIVMLQLHVCIPRTFLVINVCNQGKTLC